MNLGNVNRAQVEPIADNHLEIKLFDEYDVLQYRIQTHTYDALEVNGNAVELTERTNFTDCTFRINRNVPQIEITTV